MENQSSDFCHISYHPMHWNSIVAAIRSPYNRAYQSCMYNLRIEETLNPADDVQDGGSEPVIPWTSYESRYGQTSVGIFDVLLVQGVC